MIYAPGPYSNLTNTEDREVDILPLYYCRCKVLTTVLSYFDTDCVGPWVTRGCLSPVTD